MASKNLLIGIIIGLIVGLTAGYFLFNATDNTEIETIEAQVHDLSQQVTTLEASITTLETELDSRNALIQQKNDMISDLREELTTIQQEIDDPESQEQAPENVTLGTWDSEEYILDHRIVSSNFTSTKNMLIIRWAFPEGETSDLTLVVFDAYTDDWVYRFDRQNSTSGYEEKPIPAGLYYYYALADIEFTLTAEERP